MKTTIREKWESFKNRETRRCLEAIEMMVKSDTYRDKGLQWLGQMDIETMSVENKLHAYYVKARYYYQCYVKTQDIEHLESGNDLMDHLFAVAYDEETSIRDVRYYFTRANIKRMLSERIQVGVRRDWLLDKAKAITEKSLALYPDSSSFLWLQQQLVA